MNQLSIHVIYEYGEDLRPHASASLRLLRPLSHPAVNQNLNISFGRNLGYGYPNLVMIDRLWRPDICPQMVRDLATEVHNCGAQLIYWFDDDFLALYNERQKITLTQKESFETFLEICDACVVSSLQLKDTYSSHPRIFYHPSALDERIIINKAHHEYDEQKITIGYMGTSTHDEDLKIIGPSLQHISSRYPGKLRFQFVGVMNVDQLGQWESLRQLPIEIITPMTLENEYQLFMLWFTSRLKWDIGLAPLGDTIFNRSKSDIKFLDYAAAGVSGIFSKVPAYQSTVTDHKNGLLVSNTSDAWDEALTQLIENPSQRMAIASNASTYLYQNRIVLQCADCWRSLLENFAISA